MQLGNELRDKICTSCHAPILRDGLIDAVWEYNCWLHRKCLERAKRELANAMFLAKLYRLHEAIGEYVEHRDVL